MALRVHEPYASKQLLRLEALFERNSEQMSPNSWFAHDTELTTAIIGKSRAARSLQICVASPDIIGPIRNGGVGTAYLHIARVLREAGHEVTILYTNGDYTETEPIAHWIRHYRDLGLELAPLPRSGGEMRGSAAARVSYTAYRWLRDRPFDIIHFPEMRGHGYYSVLAKRLGLAFADARICVGAYGPTLWHKLSNAEYLDRLEDLEHDFLERKSIELADVVISPSHYLLGWMRNRGWTPPERSFVWPNPLWPPSDQQSRPRDENETSLETRPAGVVAVRELVFFGRLEDRKGLVLFCDALDRLIRDGVAVPTVTFLGKEAGIEGTRSLDYLRGRASARDWPFVWRALTDRDHQQALAYLREPGAGRIALMPSRADNSPFTVLESLNTGISFLASDVGGIPELIAAEDRDRVLFAWRADRFADKLKVVLRDGLAPARLVRPMTEIARVWADWHDVAAAESIPLPPAPESTPLVSVCMPTHNRPAMLKQALESIRAQDYPDFEVILVDDGSDDPEALRVLDELQPEFDRVGWTILREENRYPAAARNTAARRARGEYLLFMDDDNLAKPHELSTLVAAAERAGADVLTSFHHVFHGDHPPAAASSEAANAPLKLFLGDAVNLGVMSNVFGDTNALFRRDAFARIGGFTEDYGINHEDWELFAKATLKGLKLMVVPEPLYWYRETAGSVTEVTPSHANHMRCLRPYLEAVPPQLRELIFYCQGLKVGRPLAYKIVDQANAILERMPRMRRIAAKAMRSAARWGKRLRSVRSPR